MTELKALLKKLMGTDAPYFSLTYWGLAILVAAPEVLQHFGLVNLDSVSRVVGEVLVVLGIRRRLS